MESKELIERNLELIIQANYELGKISGLKEAAEKLLDAAAKKFRQGEDVTANLLRSEAKEILEQSQSKRVIYDKNYFKQAQDAFQIIIG
ncbi:MAG: hypothetical protein K0S09_34 [Sphingobacteriaceae bacterium]|jgi:hypothetical protein|nr:hypothetical protein [Sphingobacteriaceae bacterium]